MSEGEALKAHKFPELPYAYDALAPHISEQTLRLHHGKHHRKYFDTMAEMIAGSPFEGHAEEEVMRETADSPEWRKLFNNIAQEWNHAFFWRCMKTGGGGIPAGRIGREIERAFGDPDRFRQAFAEAAADEFGSGWAWLVLDGDALRVVHTTDAVNPLIHDQTPLLACDVWEHAYYLDYQNRRPEFVAAFLDNLVDWDFVERQLDPATRMTA